MNAKAQVQEIEGEVIEQPKGRAVATVGQTAVTPMDMLDRALTMGATPDTMEKLLTLQERYEKNNARKEFDEAIAAAKAEIPPIVRDATGHNSKKYVSFAAIAKVVDPIITKHGLSYRFRTAQTDRISVTCILSHKAGHSEETTLAGPPDATGNKNAIQAIGSTLTYLQRYSLVQALGLASSDDDDGRAAAAQPGKKADVGEAEADKMRDTIRDLVTEVKMPIEKFLAWAKADSISDIQAGDLEAVIRSLNERKRKMGAAP